MMTPSETGGYEEVLVLRAPQAAIQFFVCFAAYGALEFISTCLAPGFTRGHNNDAPSELFSPNKSLTELFFHADPRRKDPLNYSFQSAVFFREVLRE